MIGVLRHSALIPALVSVLLALLGGGLAPVAASSPHIVFILYDDLDIIGDLGPYGADRAEVRTPFSDLLAREGQRFERFYVNAPVCSPTRVALLTGLYPTRLGFTWASDELSKRGIPAELPTLPRRLGERGYLTGAFGKWHIGNRSDQVLPRGVGFMRTAISCAYSNLGRDGTGFLGAQFCDGPGNQLEDSGHAFATTYTVDKALEFIAEALASAPGQPPDKTARPFYAQIWLHAPHRPLTCPPGMSCPSCEPESECTAKQKRQVHHAMISHAEAQLMRLRRDLEARGVWGETLVILASDNGGVGAWHESSAELRGEKGSLFERGIRTPLLIKGPGIPVGTVAEPVAGLDLLPTLADYLGLEARENSGQRSSSPQLPSPEALRPEEPGSSSPEVPGTSGIGILAPAPKVPAPKVPAPKVPGTSETAPKIPDPKVPGTSEQQTPSAEVPGTSKQQRPVKQRPVPGTYSASLSRQPPGLSFLDRLRAEGSPIRRSTPQSRPLFWSLRPDGPATAHTLTGTWRRYAVRQVIDGVPYKLIQDDLWNGGVVPDLFDLAADEAESRNLTWQRPAIRNHLLAELRHWRLSTTPFPVETTATGEPISAGGALIDHPLLSIGRFDFSVALTIQPTATPTEGEAWLVGRPGSWSLTLAPGRVIFRIAGHRPQELSSPLDLEPGRSIRLVATIENRRGLSLFVQGAGRAANPVTRLRARFGRVPDTDPPITLAVPAKDAPGLSTFKGKISELVFYPIALQAEDLELDDLAAFAFEKTGLGLGQAASISRKAAFRGDRGLEVRRQGEDAEGGEVQITLPMIPLYGSLKDQPGGQEGGYEVGQEAVQRELQISAWLRADLPHTAPPVPARLELQCLSLDPTSGEAKPVDHPRTSYSSEYLASSAWRPVHHRHLCPPGSDAVRVHLVQIDPTTPLHWDEIRLGTLGEAKINTSFETSEIELPGSGRVDFDRSGFDRVKEGRVDEGRVDEGRVDEGRVDEGRVDEGRVDEARSGSKSLLVPIENPLRFHVQDPRRTFEISIWAKAPGRAEDKARRAGTERKAGDLTAQSILLELTCLGPDGEALALDIADQDGSRRVISNPGRLGAEWRLFRLWASCPEPGEVGEEVRAQIRLLAVGASALVDDLAVLAY